MQQTLSREPYRQFVSLSESLIRCLNDADMDEVQNKIKQYTKDIEQQCEAIKRLEPSEQSLDALKQLIAIHENITTSVNKEKEKISNELKKIRAGKVMQNAYQRR
jgi:SMC interacting uncharacterized protein involved in chromosome segregation